MQHGDDEQNGASRRSFLLSTGGLFGTAWLGSQWPAITAAAHHAEDMATAKFFQDRSYEIVEAAGAKQIWRDAVEENMCAICSSAMGRVS